MDALNTYEVRDWKARRTGFLAVAFSQIALMLGLFLPSLGDARPRYWALGAFWGNVFVFVMLAQQARSFAVALFPSMASLCIYLSFAKFRSCSLRLAPCVPTPPAAGGIARHGSVAWRRGVRLLLGAQAVIAQYADDSTF